ncbi:hypothetical protein PHLCEN_2v1587 [Hermanssonia centrifuga]|uniref:Uncharacterized protein n=1 Tax=Hermanssonia centrifuga TaxID=98765 RepID=A0A2R6RZG2_9APHY|nr:hypothetical protein PHLCEN_2v1587 [Hermanssonia centrifuga]
MSDISRQSSPRITPLSASPNRPSPLSRPHWPYTTYTHRPSSSAPSLNSTASSSSGSQAWDYRSSAGTPSPSGLVRRTSNLSMALNGVHDEGQNTRHWSFTAFEWVVRDVHRLRDYVENINTVSNLEGSNFDILKESPMLGDGKFKLEIGNIVLNAPSRFCSSG